MSEFTCINGHLMRSSDRRCRICDMPMHAMDGLTDAERGIDETGDERKMMKWDEGMYGFEHLDLGLFKITVGWKKNGYYYSYLHIESRPIFKDLETCKETAEVSAVGRLEAALKLLNK